MEKAQAAHDQLVTLSSEMVENARRLPSADEKSQALLREKLQRNARSVLFMTQTPVEAVFQHAFSGPDKTAVRIALDLRLFHWLLKLHSTGDSSPIGLQALADGCGADATFLRRIMRVLCANGFCLETGADLYVPSGMTRAITLPSLESAVRHTFDFALQVLVKMPAFFATKGYQNPIDPYKGPFQEAFQTKLGFFEKLESDPKAKKDFDTFMESSRGRKKFWGDWFPVDERLLASAKNQSPFMVDVGGGRGHDLLEFRKRFPGCGRLILQDLPETLEGLAKVPEFEAMPHDFFDVQPILGARVYFFHYITHNWPDKCVQSMLDQTARAMEPGYSKLVLNEYILPAVGCPLGPTNADIVMMADLAGQERTEAHFKALLHGVGLTEVNFYYPEGNLDGIVEAMKPM